MGGSRTVGTVVCYGRQLNCGRQYVAMGCCGLLWEVIGLYEQWDVMGSRRLQGRQYVQCVAWRP